jgi:1-acyl-sn-glycerol-3-phosphate acyltransferase
VRLPFKFMPPIVWLVRTLVGAYPRWIGGAPSANQRIYFANHTSHMDTVVLWAALPTALRANTRPVAARDYWGKGGIRQQIAERELNVVMVDRRLDEPRPADPAVPDAPAALFPPLAPLAPHAPAAPDAHAAPCAPAPPAADALAPLREALEGGYSLILFPEGTRAPRPLPGPFKSGLYHLAQGFPQVELLPVYLENLHRSMPKGALLPVPLICTVRFGAPFPRIDGEAKDAFLERARAAVAALAA